MWKTEGCIIHTCWCTLKVNIVGPHSGGKILSVGPQTETHTHTQTDTNTHTFLKCQLCFSQWLKKECLITGLCVLCTCSSSVYSGPCCRVKAWICLGFSSSTSVFSVLMSLAVTNKSRPQRFGPGESARRHGQTPTTWKTRSAWTGEPSKITANLIICLEDSRLIPEWGCSLHFCTKTSLWETNLAFLKLMETPGDYLITAVWCHNKLQTVLLSSILRLLSHRGGGGNGNRNSVTANYRLKPLLQHHLTGFAPSRWLIFLLKHPQGRQTCSVPTQLQIRRQHSAQDFSGKRRETWVQREISFLHPSFNLPPASQPAVSTLLPDRLFTLIQEQLRIIGHPQPEPVKPPHFRSRIWRARAHSEAALPVARPLSAGWGCKLYSVLLGRCCETSRRKTESKHGRRAFVRLADGNHVTARPCSRGGGLGRPRLPVLWAIAQQTADAVTQNTLSSSQGGLEYQI